MQAKIQAAYSPFQCLSIAGEVADHSKAKEKYGMSPLELKVLATAHNYESIRHHLLEK